MAAAAAEEMAVGRGVIVNGAEPWGWGLAGGLEWVHSLDGT